MRFIHTADWHIDYYNSRGRRDPDTGLPLGVLDAYNDLRDMVSYTIDNSIKFFLFAGDAFMHRLPHPNHKALVHEQLCRLNDNGVNTVLITGNHDKSPNRRQRHSLYEYEVFGLDNVHIFDSPAYLTEFDFNLLCVPWVYSKEEREVIQNPERYFKMDWNKPNVLLAHCSLSGMLYNNNVAVLDGGRDFVASHEDMRKFSYSALGHIHKPTVIEKTIVYPGSIAKNWGDAKNDDHCYVDVSVDGYTSTRFVPYSNRQMVDLVWSVSSSSELEAKIAETEFPVESRYRITVVSDGYVNTKKLSDALENTFEHKIIIKRIDKNRRRNRSKKDLSKMDEEGLLKYYYKISGYEWDQETFDSIFSR